MALYLKYRPQTFSDLTGQEFIKNTLKIAVGEGKTVGAYIFTGPRGTGKTSTARIFAKAINCETPLNGDPCGTCSICSSFGDNNLIDIIEIDAASYTGVDNIRDIIEKAQFRPTQTKYKIYIVDEVHMLSKGAFNALLKILEEPPEHVKFILATTEIHKVPDTILSRCQRYDFKNFSDADITSRLQYIAGEEKVEVDEESYKYIVKNSEGGMRNAVSLFEQLIHNNKISYDYVVETLGIASDDQKNLFIQKLRNTDASVLDDFSQMYAEGKNMKNFFKSIISEIQKQAIIAVQNDGDISNDIYLLETLQDMLIKSKQSFDEAMTLQIGLLKIVNPYSHTSPPQSEKTLSVSLSGDNKDNIKEKPVQKSTNISPEKIEKSSEISPEHVEDIFGGAEDISPESLSQKEKINFDVDTLILKVREHGGKAALSMSLKGSDFSFQDGVVIIQTKTKISAGTISKTENKEILMQALSDMGEEFSDIKVL